MMKLCIVLYPPAIFPLKPIKSTRLFAFTQIPNGSKGKGKVHPRTGNEGPEGE